MPESIDVVVAVLNARFDGLEKSVEAKFVAMEKSVDGKFAPLNESLNRVTDDHEQRLRRLERWSYGIPAAVVIALGTAAAEIIKAVGG